MNLLALALIFLSCPICIVAAAWFIYLKRKLTAEEKSNVKQSLGIHSKAQAVLALLALVFGILGVFYFGINYSIVLSIPLILVVGVSEILDQIHFLLNMSDASISSGARKAWIVPGLLGLVGIAFSGAGTILYLLL